MGGRSGFPEPPRQAPRSRLYCLERDGLMTSARIVAPPTGFEPVTNGLLQWTFHFNSFSLSPRAESAALPLSSRPQTSEGTAARLQPAASSTPENRFIKRYSKKSHPS